jgi:hypothetical protein
MSDLAVTLALGFYCGKELEPGLNPVTMAYYYMTLGNYVAIPVGFPYLKNGNKKNSFFIDQL